ncbi:MAG: hypothetical protein ABI390_06275 [Daejeonella sp.]
MKKLNNRGPLILLVVGAVIMNFTFILERYFTLTDTENGLIKGIGLGLMILSLISSSIKRKENLRGKANS